MSMTQGVLFIPIVILGNLWFGLAGIIWALTVTEGLVLARRRRDVARVPSRDRPRPRRGAAHAGRGALGSTCACDLRRRHRRRGPQRPDRRGLPGPRRTDRPAARTGGPRGRRDAVGAGVPGGRRQRVALLLPGLADAPAGPRRARAAGRAPPPAHLLLHAGRQRGTARRHGRRGRDRRVVRLGRGRRRRRRVASVRRPHRRARRPALADDDRAAAVARRRPARCSARTTGATWSSGPSARSSTRPSAPTWSGASCSPTP